ncbi:MAG: outer membrane beta-barrel protein [Nitrospirota bacterium]
MDLNYQISRQELGLLLKKDFLRYSHYTDQDTDQDEVNRNVTLRVLDRISAGLRGSYTKKLVERENYWTKQKNERTTEGSGLSISYDLPSGFSIQAGFRQEKEDFSLFEFRFRERTNRYYSGTLSYSPSPESKFYSVYQRNVLDYDLLQPIGGTLVNNDSTGDVIKVGVDRKFSPKTSLSFYAGYLWRRHEEFKARDFHGVIGKAQVYYGITEKMNSRQGYHSLQSED